MKKNILRFALTGNPNCGKSTLFNQITGARQHIGNYPGVTIERVEGKRLHDGIEFRLIDLPGTYSLFASSEEELVARNVLLEEKPDLVVNIVDATHLERHLFLTLELLDAGFPLLLVLNMSDLAKARGIQIDCVELSRQLKIPVLETVGYDPQSARAILDKGAAWLESSDWSRAWPIEADIINAGTKQEEAGQEEVGQEESERAAERFHRISGLCRSCVQTSVNGQTTGTDRLDRVFLHRFWGIPIFLLLMYLVFQLTFTLGQYPMDALESFFHFLGSRIDALFTNQPDRLLRSFLIDGVLGGVGGVLVFLPNIILLFLAIAILEDSGYMARAAFLMNRFLTWAGLHGKSFIPMLLGFGCSVPAIMATRTLENSQTRRTTLFIIPLMSCGARLPIYTLIIPAFFPPVWRAPILWGLYVFGVVLAVAVALLLRKTIFKGGDSSLILELPSYHLPNLRTITSQTLRQGWLYLRKAGTIILGISVCLWFLTTFPKPPKEVQENFRLQRQALIDTPDLTIAGYDITERETTELDRAEAETALAWSAVGRMGHALEPLLRPIGFDWKAGTALLGAIAAKEVFVAQMGIVFKVEGDAESDSLREVLAQNYSPLSGLCILLFCLIGMPCMATFAIVAKETLSWRFALTQWVTLTALAWLVAAIVYQTGLLFRLGVF